ncbi:hypothetical protein NEOLI_002807 [Neolecta irregularis DAH-3]|uniref:Uncharacterized protein n=1 Tax=Neolecta irregularis (strain DAH-3) TaxID=1198029 RepID=A0A1U7LHG1_NEOID|nr:hypothetical protein NEOLI_002807 [Neolecta irregularis DAH-3]|eukprot:OLL22096.1 hypothetical protein NEOLI_002807 [Neolecta irregularis DAH-3]
MKSKPELHLSVPKIFETTSPATAQPVTPDVMPLQKSLSGCSLDTFLDENVDSDDSNTINNDPEYSKTEEEMMMTAYVDLLTAPGHVPFQPSAPPSNIVRAIAVQIKRENPLWGHSIIGTRKHLHVLIRDQYRRRQIKPVSQHMVFGPTIGNQSFLCHDSSYQPLASPFHEQGSDLKKSN